MCGLPGERAVDLDCIVDMAEHISTIGKEVKGRYVEVTAAVSNFVPKPHTPYQWNGMQTREYLQWAGQYLKKRCRIRAVRVKQHDIECSLLEGEVVAPEIEAQVQALVDEFLGQLQAGGEPDVYELLRTHPSLAPEVERRLEAVFLLHQLALTGKSGTTGVTPVLHA